ncbi:MAG: Rne/Rng family ribonuclease [Bdellovibrionaceae bacterium]|nr:Rne/Rng family ribonuclease [Pseudobdellovibrionaceae bacterium]
MRSEILIESNRLETRIAYLEKGELVDYKVERKTSPTLVGSVYRGRVVRVLPGMQAAFIDIGLERAAFLYVGDVRDEDFPFDSGDELPKEWMDKDRPKIQELLTEGQTILVQVSKDPMGTKGARLTTHISLASRRIVYLPTLNHFGISRRIEAEEERDRLKKLLEENVKSGGVIVRTAGESMTEAELKLDIDFTHKQWVDIQKHYTGGDKIGLIRSEEEYSLRILRDLLNPAVDNIWVEGKETYEKIRTFVGLFMPRYIDKVYHYFEKEPLFARYGVDVEVEKALARKVWLRSGGYLVIDETEALVVIDVNTGKYVGKKDLEDTIFKTNMEAIKEIAHQIRLRDCGGIIIVDFIDMTEQDHRDRVLAAFEEEVKRDRVRVSIISMTGLGLVELTRKRLRSSLRRTLTDSCFYCEGMGTLKKKETIVCEIFRDLSFTVKKKTITQPVIIHCHTDIVNWVYSEESEMMDYFEEELGVPVIFRTDVKLHFEEYKIET